jgi:hypothetical protein
LPQIGNAVLSDKLEQAMLDGCELCVPPEAALLKLDSVCDTRRIRYIGYPVSQSPAIGGGTADVLHDCRLDLLGVGEVDRHGSRV